MTRLIRSCTLLVAVAAALLASGCGDRKPEVRTVGETEGIYVDIGELKYQVQMSRLLNPADREDTSYLKGLPAGSELASDAAWFAVFVRAQNTTSDKTLPSAREFELIDSLGNHYEPVPIDLSVNDWAYRPAELAPGDVVPLPNTVQAEGPIKGGMLLFRVPVASLQNRPLELEFRSPLDHDEVGIIDLDV